MTALTMLEKLSSVRMMSDASLATSVPAMPWGRTHNDQGSVSSHNMFNIIMSLREHYFADSTVVAQLQNEVLCCLPTEYKVSMD